MVEQPSESRQLSFSAVIAPGRGDRPGERIVAA